MKKKRKRKKKQKKPQADKLMDFPENEEEGDFESAYGDRKMELGVRIEENENGEEEVHYNFRDRKDIIQIQGFGPNYDLIDWSN